MNVLITGGAGFIGVNTAEYFLKKGDKVWIFDNLSRKGSSHNLEYLEKIYPKVRFIRGDVRNAEQVKKTIKDKDIVFHFAAQVAVTTSVINPREDFEINVLGTLNVLEAIRKSSPKTILIFSSTNKVYGNIEGEEIIENELRYDFRNVKGIDEQRPLDFHSPYGCSKGSADQYVRDYSRIYGLRTVVFRQSCIYGPRQFGVEDQGWVAWFIIALLTKKNITIYGDGKQVRDILYISDLIEAYDKVVINISKTKGNVFNIGGGTKNSIAIWYEFVPILEKLFGRKIKAIFSDWRPGDQKIYTSDISKAKKVFDWSPTVSTGDGIKKLYEWALKNRNLFV